MSIIAPLLLFLLFQLNLGAFIQSASIENANLTDLELLTDLNREYDPDTEGPMMGGWGPHLKSVMKAPGGDLWFVVDQGPNVYQNQKIDYYRFNEGTWEKAAENTFDGFLQVQQNTASIMLDRFILSYGIDIQNQKLMECYLDTADVNKKACKPVVVGNQELTLPEGSNYIGAAISPSGYRTVWWTKVGDPGKFFHMWNFGSGWNGPVSTDIVVSGNTYEYIGYVHADYVNDYQLEMIGQSGRPSENLYVAINISVQINNSYPKAVFSWIGPQEFSVAPRDIWVEDLTKDLHAIAAYTNEKGVYIGTAYYYKAQGSEWELVGTLPGTDQARFLFEERSDLLYLITGKNLISSIDNIQVRSIHRNQILKDGAIDWEHISHTPAAIFNIGFDSPNAIYTQSRAYQTTRIECLNFAVVGDYPDFDNFIVSYQGVTCEK